MAWPLFGRKKKPKIEDRTSGSAYEYFAGITTSGKTVNEKNSMEISAVYACVRVLAETMASLPVGLYTRGEHGERVKATDHPLYKVVHSEPNPEMTWFNFCEALETHLLLWGNAYAQKIKNAKGEVIALYPLMPDRMKVDRDEKGQLYYEFQRSDGDASTTSKERKQSTIRFKPEQILHIPGLSFDGLVGYSPIAMAKNTIGMSQACEEYGAKFFKNGASPSGVLKHPGTLADPDKVRESWNRSFAGSANAGKVAVLEEGMDYSPVTLGPEQAQFLQTRQYQIDEIARIFRVPPHLIGDLSRATFSNIEQQSLEFVKYSLDPWLTRWEQAMNRSLLSDEDKEKYYFKFNVDALLRGDYASRMQGYAIARQNGWMSTNDIRRLEDMDLLSEEEGGDLYLINGNMAKLKDAGAAYEQQLQAGQMQMAMAAAAAQAGSAGTNGV